MAVMPCVAQVEKAYVKYFNTASHRNTEGDLLVKTDGSYYCVWSQFHQSWEDNAACDLAAKYSVDSGRNWIDLGVIQENIGLQTTSSVSLIRITSSVVHLYFCVKNADTDLSVYRKVSTDDCGTWGAPELVVSDGDYMPVLNSSAIKLSSGRIIIPVYTSPNAGVIPPNYFYVFSWYSDDNGASWSRSTPDLVHTTGFGYAEPNLFETSSGLKMNIRVQLGGAQIFSNSTDNGATWGTPYTSTLSSTGSPATIIRLSTGNLIAIHNPVLSGFPHPRSVLRISRSVNEGATWVQLFDLESNKANFNFSYSSAFEHDGRLLVTYWELNPTAGKYALKFAAIPLSML